MVNFKKILRMRKSRLDPKDDPEWHDGCRIRDDLVVMKVHGKDFLMVVTYDEKVKMHEEMMKMIPKRNSLYVWMESLYYDIYNWYHFRKKNEPCFPDMVEWEANRLK